MIIMKKLLFVCSGNTCRSPIAEAIFEHITGENAESAGLGAVLGDPMSRNAVFALENMGIMGFVHKAQPVSLEKVAEADEIYCMGLIHKLVLMQTFPQYKNKVFLLDMEGKDISDPYGGMIDIYEKCAAQIENCIKSRLEQWKS